MCLRAAALVISMWSIKRKLDEEKSKHAGLAQQQLRMWVLTARPALDRLPVVSHHSLAKTLKLSHEVFELLPQAAGYWCPRAISGGSFLASFLAPVGDVRPIKIFKFGFDGFSDLRHLSYVLVHSLSQCFHCLSSVHRLGFFISRLYLCKRLFHPLHLPLDHSYFLKEPRHVLLWFPSFHAGHLHSLARLQISPSKCLLLQIHIIPRLRKRLSHEIVHSAWQELSLRCNLFWFFPESDSAAPL